MPFLDAHADPGFMLVPLVDEGKPPERGINQDRLLVRPSRKVSVKHQGGPDADAPMLVGADIRQKAVCRLSAAATGGWLAKNCSK